MNFPPLPFSSAFRFCRLAALSAAGAASLTFANHGAAAEPNAPEKTVHAEQVTAAPAPAAETTEAEEHGLPTAAVTLYYGIGGHPAVFDASGKETEKAVYGPFAMTNSILVSWIVAISIIIFSRIATVNAKQIPEGIQNFFEWLVESLRNFLEGILGRDLVKKTFWFFATIFIFILALNWFSLIPGTGTIGWGHYDPVRGHFHVVRPLLRGANADLNLTLAMSLLFFVCWIVWALQANGFGGFLLHLFGAKGEQPNLGMKIGMGVAFFIVGWLEVVSILFRPVSLSFRLYGNIFAGENVLEAMSNLVPALAPVIPIPFYFMELLVGIAQALVFMLLTAVFTLLICAHDESHAEKHH
jgi:F-type H+-transporting ATPase subunit a